MKKFLLLLGVLINLFVVSSSAVWAQEIGDDVFVSNGDVYMLEDEIYVTKPVEGDLFIIGGEVVIREKVQEDLFIIANTIRIEAEIEGDVRVLGNQIEIKGDINEDLLVTASKVMVNHDVKIGGNMYMFGENLVLDGEVKGNVVFEGRKISLFGVIDGHLWVTAKNIWMDDNGASIGENMYYKANEQQTFSGNVVKGEIFFEKEEGLSGWELFMTRVVWKGLGVGNNLLLAILLISFASGFLWKRGIEISKRPFNNTMIGLFVFLGLFSIPVMIVMTYVGIKLAVIMMLLLGLCMLLGSTLGAIWVASMWVKSVDTRKGRWLFLGLTTLVLALIALLGAIVPVAGTITSLLLSFLGIGGLVKTYTDSLKV